jgi:hypothetical protein
MLPYVPCLQQGLLRLLNLLNVIRPVPTAGVVLPNLLTMSPLTVQSQGRQILLFMSERGIEFQMYQVNVVK